MYEFFVEKDFVEDQSEGDYSKQQQRIDHESAEVEGVEDFC